MNDQEMIQDIKNVFSHMDKFCENIQIEVEISDVMNIQQLEIVL